MCPYKSSFGVQVLEADPHSSRNTDKLAYVHVDTRDHQGLAKYDHCPYSYSVGYMVRTKYPFYIVKRLPHNKDYGNLIITREITWPPNKTSANIGLRQIVLKK